jgi:pimeloyl-ACP methyl ester carboxylesterase
MSNNRKRIQLIAVCALTIVIAALCVVLLKKPHQNATVAYELVQAQRSPMALNIALSISRVSGLRERYLLIYLHGLGGTYLEPYKAPAKRTFAAVTSEKFPTISLASCDYGRPIRWYKSSDMDDITLEIKRLGQKVQFDKIIMAGSSMGGSAALCYATAAPEEIRRKIVGIIAIYPAGDLVELYRTTRESVITFSLEKAFGGAPDRCAPLYLEASSLPRLANLAPSTKVYVISAQQDTVVPTALQNQLVASLERKNIPVHLEKLQCNHLKPPPPESFERALHFVADAG